MVWALAPLVAAAPALRRVEWLDWAQMRRALPELFPHVGSTAIIGISIYAFRLLILLLGGRSLAGDLFTAFALGSFAGSVFANVLGPSLVWHHARTGERGASWLDRLVLPGLLLTGAIIFAAGWGAGTASLFGRQPLFWEAVGLSLMGGAAMLLAQRLRLALLQDSSGVSVFGADMMINLLLLATIPFVYTLWGESGLVTLYAANAILCLLFYASAQGRYQFHLKRLGVHRAWLPVSVGILLLAPIFVQLGGGIYHSAQALIDSGGILLSVPLPLSVPITVLGILLLGRFRRAQLSLSVLFVLFLGMLLAAVISTHGELQEERRKLVLLLQFLVPVFGLVLGQMLGATALRQIAAGFLICLGAFVPAQLIATWLHGQVLLSHDLGLIGIYQHRQYVPVIMVAAYLCALFALAGQRSWRQFGLALAPLMAVYVVASTSVLALLGLFLGMIGYTRARANSKDARRCLTVLALCALAYFFVAIQSPEFSAKFSYQDHAHASLLPDSFQIRVTVWGNYLAAIAGDVPTIAFGHARPPERWVSTGAHNYYLDFIYHFGVFALLPLLFLAWHTGTRLWQARERVHEHPELLGLALVITFLLFADNGWKVALRQPYSGILSFFLWGLLLAKLEKLRAPLARAAKVAPGVVSHAH
jgi:hypothetical protein